MITDIRNMGIFEANRLILLTIRHICDLITKRKRLARTRRLAGTVLTQIFLIF